MNNSTQKKKDTTYEEVVPVPALNIAELEEVKCLHPIGSQTYLFYCKPKNRYRGGCLYCGSINHYIHGYIKKRLVHDISMGITSVDLIIKVPRYKCNDCDGTFVHPLESVVEGTGFTKRLYELIKTRALDGAFAPLAREYGVSISTIASILSNYGKELDKERTIVAPRVLGIDEKHIVHKTRGVFVDVINGKLIEMTVDNEIPTMKQVINNMVGTENIEVVTIDMCHRYRNIIEECLPQAKIVIDKYHVIQNLYQKVNTTKKELHLYLKNQVDQLPNGPEKDYKELLITRFGKNTYLFKFGLDKLKKVPDRTSLMFELCETFPEINTLRILKEGAEYIYTTNNREEAEKLFEQWQNLLPTKNKLYKEIFSFNRTLEQWKPYIFNYFDDGCRYTNAATEGINSLIGTINGVGRGYKFDILRIKALYHKKAKDIPSFKLRKDILIDFEF